MLSYLKREFFECSLELDKPNANGKILENCDYLQFLEWMQKSQDVTQFSKCLTSFLFCFIQCTYCSRCSFESVLKKEKKFLAGILKKKILIFVVCSIRKIPSITLLPNQNALRIYFIIRSRISYNKNMLNFSRNVFLIVRKKFNFFIMIFIHFILIGIIKKERKKRKTIKIHRKP